MQKEKTLRLKNIVLDLGGVIMDVSYEATADAFKKLGVENFDELFSKKKQEHFFDNYEKGLIPDEDFRNDIKKQIEKPLSDAQIDAAWNAMLFTIPPHRIEFLKTLKKKYRLFLLSNTNQIHIRYFKEKLKEDFDENILEKVFEKIYFSCLVHKRKPDADIFELVLNENKLIKEETIFIDDSIQHVVGAKKIGLPAYYLDLSKHTLETLLPGILSEKILNTQH